MVNILHIVRDFWVLTLVPLGMVGSYYWEKKNNEKLSMYRNKSVLYRRELKPGEEVTWR